MAASLPAVTGSLPGVRQATMSAGLCVSVTGLDRQGQRGGMPGSGLADLTSGKERASEAVERLGLTRAIACLTVEGKRLPEVHGGLPVAALPQLGKAKPG